MPGARQQLGTLASLCLEQAGVTAGQTDVLVKLMCTDEDAAQTPFMMVGRERDQAWATPVLKGTAGGRMDQGVLESSLRLGMARMVGCSDHQGALTPLQSPVTGWQIDEAVS